MGTFGDDAPIRELDVLGAAAGDQGHGWELAEALFDAHSGEGQQSQVIPGEHGMGVWVLEARISDLPQLLAFAVMPCSHH